MYFSLKQFTFKKHDAIADLVILIIKRGKRHEKIHHKNFSGRIRVCIPLPSSASLYTGASETPEMVLDVVKRMAFIAFPGRGRQTWLHP